jgi:hypothetical protein
LVHGKNIALVPIVSVSKPQPFQYLVFDPTGYLNIRRDAEGIVISTTCEQSVVTFSDKLAVNIFNRTLNVCTHLGDGINFSYIYQAVP